MNTLNILILPAVKNIEEIAKQFSCPITLTKGSYSNIEFISQDNILSILYKGKDIREFSFVWLSSSWKSRDLAYAVKIYLEKYKIPHSFTEKSTSKITDHIFFTLNNIPTPNTFFSNHQNKKQFLSRIQEVCGSPIIIKDSKGSRGIRSFLIRSQEELEKILDNTALRNKQYFFQQYIPNDYDWGVLVVNGKVVSGEKSYTKKGEFLNNSAFGSREVFVDVKDIPLPIQKMAIRACSSLDLSWSRADIIIDKNTNTPYLMEVNRFPGLTSKSTEIDGAYTFLSKQIRSLV